MVRVDYSQLDQPQISVNSFYPRPNRSPTPEGAQDHTVEVDEGVALTCRFFSAGQHSPTVLFFYGNGETSADYDDIAPLYTQIGVNFFVADYRGYGASGGSPSFTTMLSDSHKVLAALNGILESGGFTGPLFVMGRSMGRHAAFELGANPCAKLQGMIIESGRPSLAQFVHGLDAAAAEVLEAAYLGKIQAIDLPVLVIHGELDNLAPVQFAISMYEDFPSLMKRLVIVPGAGHNDLLYVGLNEYFSAIHEFVGRSASPPDQL